jgi:mycothiol synthase
VIIRPALPADAAGVQAVCAASLPFEPDAADLPAVLGIPPRAGLALVAEDDGNVTGVVSGSLRQALPGAACGYADLIAVAPQARGRGTGAGLLGALEDELRSRGATEIRLAGNPPVYLWPGIDPRYTALTCLAERAGYERCGDAVNMAVDLDVTPLDTRDEERRLASCGIAVRRARPDEAGAVAGWLREGPWGRSSWPEEAERALARGPAGCHIAARDGCYIAFACHGCVRDGWFGPTGTLEHERRNGIGAVLLKRCLADIREAGHRSAQIAWTGPVRFYARAVGARIDRVFWLYRKRLGIDGTVSVHPERPLRQH